MKLNKSFNDYVFCAWIECMLMLGVKSNKLMHSKINLSKLIS